MLAAHIQQFYCFEVLGEMSDRLTTSAQAQLVKERQHSIIALLLFYVNNLFAVQNLEMALKKANILQHTESFFV